MHNRKNDIRRFQKKNGNIILAQNQMMPANGLGLKMVLKLIMIWTLNTNIWAIRKLRALVCIFLRSPKSIMLLSAIILLYKLFARRRSTVLPRNQLNWVVFEFYSLSPKIELYYCLFLTFWQLGLSKFHFIIFYML